MIDMNKEQSVDQSSEEQLQYSTFYLEDTLCAINIEHVQEINEELNITKVPLSPEYVMGIMNLRGQIVTIINLSMKIGLSPSKITSQSRIMIVSSKGEQIGLLVDKVSEVVTTSKNDISPPPANIQGVQGEFFEGILNTDNHELIALLNVNTVLLESDPEKR